MIFAHPSYNHPGGTILRSLVDMSHRAQQPSTASSSFAYSSFDPSATASTSSHSVPRQPDEYLSYSYSDYRSPSEGLDYHYDYDRDREADSDSPRHEPLTGNETSTQPDRPSSPRRTPSKRSDSIFSLTSLGPARSTKKLDRQESRGSREPEGQGAFQGAEYTTHDPFSLDLTHRTDERRTRRKRYGLTEEETTSLGVGEPESDTDSEDFELFNFDRPNDDEDPDHERSLQSPHSIVGSPRVGGGKGFGAKRNRFEALTAQELTWMAVSAVLTVGLMTGAVVVAIVG